MDETITRVRNKLIELAKNKKVIWYEELVTECNLDLKFENDTDRIKIGDILGEVSEYELHSTPQRPPLSVLVGSKTKHPHMPSDGFFKFMDREGIRKPNETDEQMRNRLMIWCYEYWSNH